MQGARILIAGCGDLGMRVAHRLAKEPGCERVYGLRRNPLLPSSNAIEWIRADLGDVSSLVGLPPGITHVLYTPTPGSRSEEAYRNVFVEGLKHLLNSPACSRLQRVVFVSSSAVYGEHAGDWIDETTPVAPQGFNGRILLQAEQLLINASRDSGISATSLRLAGLYGPGRLQLIERIRRGEARAPIDPPHWSNRIHIDDAAAACVTLLGLDHVLPCYLGCDDTPLPQHALYTALAEHIHAPIIAEGAPPAHVGSKRMRNDALRATGWRPTYPDAREGYVELIDATIGDQSD